MMVSITLTLAGLGRDGLGIFTPASPEFRPMMTPASPFIVIGWLAITAIVGGYDRQVLGAGTDEYRRVLNASFLTGAVVGIGCFVLDFDLSRGFYVLALLIGPTLLLFGRFCLRDVVQRARQRGLMSHRVLIVGSEAHIDEVAAVLDRESWMGYELVGALTPGPLTSAASRRDSGVAILGHSGSVVSLAHDLEADVVFFAGGAVDSAAELRELAWEFEDSPCQVVVAPSVTDVSPERVRIRPVGGLPLLHLDKPRAARAKAKAKRTFDVVGASLLILLLSPVLTFCAYKVWRFDGLPIMFRHGRIGLDGKTFDCLKFRTMVIDAESKLAEVLAEQGEEHSVFAKLKDDPRITGPGHWLRRFSLDELPQLFNVLRGDMSLVGPRPQVADEVALYDDAMSRRLHVRPGMTGLWQVSGRSDLSWPRRPSASTSTTWTTGRWCRT